eukprot:RCo005596
MAAPGLSLRDRAVACMLLGAAGDTIGYRGGSWEFNSSGPAIHAELRELHGGVEGLDVQGWIYSDDTVQHIATAQALISHGAAAAAAVEAAGFNRISLVREFRELCAAIGQQYVETWPQM